MKLLLNRLTLLALLLCVSSIGLDAQKALRIGGGKDAMGHPLPAVQVIPVGATASGAVTDLDGKYTVNVPKGITQLKFTYIGMRTEQVPINHPLTR